MHTAAEGYINQYPTPNQLWESTFNEDNQWRERTSCYPL
jgi:type I restriction enzyme R subunit